MDFISKSGIKPVTDKKPSEKMFVDLDGSIIDEKRDEKSPSIKEGLGISTLGLSTPNPGTELAKELRLAINKRNILTTKSREKLLISLEKMETNFEHDKRNRQKERALCELVSSEAKYVSQLGILLEFFIKPITMKKLLMGDDFETLFGHVQTIYNINKELLDELNKGLENVVNSFSKIAPFLKIYSVYACKYGRALKLLELAKIQNPNFAKFVENQESRPEVQTKLSALLIIPIQRIPRYKLLLNDIFQQTLSSDADFDILQDCLIKVEAAAMHINNLLEKQENAQKLLEIQRYLQSGNFNIIKPGRRLIKEGTLHKFCSQKKHHDFYVVLTNDLIIFCKMKKCSLVTGSLKVEYIFPLNMCAVIESWEKGCFQVDCPPEQILLYHEDSAEMHRWIHDIQEAVFSSIESRKSLKKFFSERRAVKRKNIEEYHEVGISPGKPLKKKNRHDIPENTSPMLPHRSIISRRPISACNSTPVFAEKSDVNYLGYPLKRNSFFHCSEDSTSNSNEQAGESLVDTQNASRLTTFIKSFSSRFKDVFSWRPRVAKD